MKKQITIIYDDLRPVSSEIRSITGKNSFGATILKRKTFRERTAELITKIEIVAQAVSISVPQKASFPEIKDKCLPVVRLFSDFIINDLNKIEILFEKACYADRIYRIKDDYENDASKKHAEIKRSGGLCAVIYPSYELYRDNADEEELSSFPEIITEAFIDLSDMNNFRQYITSGFDARFFNALSGDEYTVVKSSSNKKKIKAEYEYYRLLPEEMRMWYALAFNYRETESEASYTMERFHFTDLAIRYVHGAIDETEFSKIMDKLFFFLKSRKKKSVSSEEYDRHLKVLYVDKVKNRIEELKSMDEFAGIESLLRTGTDLGGIDQIVQRYYSLYEKMMEGRTFEHCLTVGHGDLCFSNILYNKESEVLKLIDPKGALSEEELYMNPYYDLCKLSHSICGSYDYFNSGLFEITLSDENRLKLSIDSDNGRYIKIFSDKAQEYGYDFSLIRLYEASLFLSMLPLHIDRKKKVLGFILNAVKIMDAL
ncbi:MAG: hypothetical protein K5770_06360 [Lachnospiraceae bacterium]|nr:hypothetical protein [Lachnospiraceae bacterium]